MSMELDFTGANELLAAFADLEGPVAEEAIRLGVKAAATVIADAMREAAPVLDARSAKSTALQPGSVRDDIRVVQERPKDGIVTALIGPGKETQHVALWVEYGHRLVKGGYSKMLANGKTRGPGADGGRVEPHPFLRPAFDESEEKAMEQCATVGLEAIREGKR